MELHAFDVQFSVAEPHDRAVVRFGGNLQAARQRLPFDDQRVITRGLKFLRQAAKNRFAVVLDAAGLAVH